MATYSSVDDIRKRLAVIEGQILTSTGSGSGMAFPYAPQNIDDALPAFVTFAGDASYELGEDGAQYITEDRKYMLRLFVTQIGTGIDGEAEALATSYIDATKNALLSHPGLGNGTIGSAMKGVIQQTPLRDSGVAMLTYAEQNYLGCEFEINVTQIQPRNYAIGD